MSDARASSVVGRGSSSSSVFIRWVLVFAVWTALVVGQPQGLLLGLVVLPWLVWSGRLHPDRFLGLLLFCVGFLPRVGRHLLWRVFRRRQRLAVLVVCHARSRLPRGPARQFLFRVLGLVPGMLAMKPSEDQLTLRLPDESPAVRAAALAWVRDLERRVARFYGLTPPPRGLP